MSAENLNSKELFAEKMKGIQDRLVGEMSAHFEPYATEAHIMGSVARGEHDAFSDIDIWVTYEDSMIQEAIENRMGTYKKFGEIVLLHEMQNNYPLNGIQTAIVYKIDVELFRVDFYLCPLSSSTKKPGSKVLFEKKEVPVGEIIPETKRAQRDASDRVTFLICMCFNSIKKIARGNTRFMDFLSREFKKLEEFNDVKGLPELPVEGSFDSIRSALSVLEGISNDEQKRSIDVILEFMGRVERMG